MLKFQPKGGMCAGCTRAYLDCSGLPFDTMPTIGRDGPRRIVKCTYHQPGSYGTQPASEAEKLRASAERIKERQAALEMSNKGMAEALGVSLSTVTKWRAGSHAVPQMAWLALNWIAREREQEG